VEVECLLSQDVDTFVQVPIGGGLGHPNALPCRLMFGLSPNQAITNWAFGRENLNNPSGDLINGQGWVAPPSTGTTCPVM
jgi:hypothetical protein